MSFKLRNNMKILAKSVFFLIIIYLVGFAAYSQCDENCSEVYHGKTVTLNTDTIFKYDYKNLLNHKRAVDPKFIFRKEPIFKFSSFFKGGKYYFDYLASDTCCEVFSFNPVTKSLKKLTDFKSVLKEKYNFKEFKITENGLVISDEHEKYQTLTYAQSYLIDDLVLFIFRVDFRESADYYIYCNDDSLPRFSIKSCWLEKIRACNNKICINFTETKSKFNYWYPFFFWVKHCPVQKWLVKFGNEYTYVFDKQFKLIDKKFVKNHAEED